MAEENIDVRIRLREKRQFTSDTRQAASDVDRFTDAAGRARDAQGRFVAANDETHRSLLRGSRSAGIFGNRTNVLSRGIGFLTTRISAAGIATVALVKPILALSASAISLSASIAPVSGALIAYPGFMAAAAQGSMVWKLATGGLSEAVGGLNEKLDTNSKAFKNLSPEGQRFARTLQGLKPEMRSIQQTAQRGLFPGMRQGLLDARKNFPIVERVVGRTARALGNLARSAGEAFSTPQWGRDLERIGNTNVVILTRLGRAAGSTANALRHIWISAGPTLRTLAGDVGTLAERFERATKAGRESGKLSAYFERARAKVWQLGHILSDIIAILFHVGRASRASGDTMLNSIGQVLERWRAWTASVRGQNAMKVFFERSRLYLVRLTNTLRDQARIWANPNLSLGQKIEASIRRLRLGEALAAILRQALPVMAESATAMAPVLLAAFIRGFMEADAAGKLAIALFLGRSLVFAAIASGVSAAASWVAGFVGAMAAARGVTTAALLAAILPPVAIALVVAGLIYLFRKPIANAFGWVKKAAWKAFRWVVMAFNLAVAFVKAVPGRIWNTPLFRWVRAAARAAWIYIRAAWFTAVRFVKSIPSRIWNTPLFRWVRAAARTAWIYIRAAWFTIVRFVKSIPGRIARTPLFRWVHKAVINARNWIVRTWHNIVKFVRRLPGRIAAAARGMWKGIVDAFRGPYNTIAKWWNNLKLQIGGHRWNLGKLFGWVKVPTLTLGTPNIPLMEMGGTITGAGAAIVGEAGPELVNLPSGASVQPLMPKMPDTASPIDTRALPPIRLINQIYLDGEQIHESVGNVTEDRLARR